MNTLARVRGILRFLVVFVVACTAIGGQPTAVAAASTDDSPARVLVLGDSVFHSFHHIASARRLMNARQPTLFATQTCQRLVSPGCRPSAQLSTLDHLRRFAGKFTDVVVIGTGYNDRIGPDFKAAVTAITDEARNQGVDVLWVNYREVRHVRGKARVMNEQLVRLDSAIDNLGVVDWNAHSADGKGWFRPDRLHLIGPGADNLAVLLNESLAPLLAARDAARTTVPAG